MTSAFDRVAAAVDRWLPEWFGDEAESSWAKAPVRYEWSWQFRPMVKVGRRTVELVVKVPVWDEAPTLEQALAAGPQEDTMCEVAELEAIEAAIGRYGNGGLAAVEVCGYVRDANAIVMHRLPSKPLRARLAGPAGSRDSDGWFRGAGRWLALYHEHVAGVAVEPFPIDATLARIEGLVASLGDRGRDASAVAGDLGAAVRSLAGRPARITRTHGDFNLANVLVTEDGRVASLDPNRYPGVAEEDLARLIVDVRTHRTRALTLGLVPSRTWVTRWERALVTAYAAADLEILDVLVAEAILRRWDDVESGSGALRKMAMPALRRRFAVEGGLAAESLAAASYV